MTKKKLRKPKTVITRRPRLIGFGSSTLFPRFFLRIVPLMLLLVFCLGLVATAAEAPGQDKKEKPYALLFGTVWGPDAHPIYGVRVKIRRAEEKKARWELYSDHRGEFAQRLPAGKADYVVWADLKGAKLNGNKELTSQEDAKVHFEFDERVDVSLHLK